MIDKDGIEWLGVADAARIVRVRESAIYVWVQRRKVTSHRIGGRAFVRMPDVMEAEYAWRMRAQVRAGISLAEPVAHP